MQFSIGSLVRSRRRAGSEGQLSRMANVADLREHARRKLPKGVFDYIDGGAEDEVTMQRNSGDFRALEFNPRVLTGLESVDPSTSLLGRAIAYPIVLSPTGFTRIVHPDGELAVARSAARAGIPYVLSTLGTFSIEEVAEEADNLWFQLYVWRDRALVKELIARATENGCLALCVTVDTAVLGRRERDVRRGFKLPPRIGLDTLIDTMIHPRWAFRALKSERIVFANVRGQSVGDGTDAITLSDYVAGQFDRSLSWDDLEWIQSEWSGPLVVKGVQTVADARIAARLGVDAIALSSHGGRQLDGAPTPISILNEVVDAIGGETAIIVDGGVRRGSDVVKAVALGATAVMIGRPYLYGLGAFGEKGVDHVLGLLRSDIERVMALIGVESMRDVTLDALRSTGADRARQ